MASPVLRRETIDGVLWLTKDDPRQSNGITFAMAEALEAALDDRADARAIVITAADGFHGSAALVREMSDSPASLQEGDFHRITAIGRHLGDQIAKLPIPVIGVARAGALGGGLELLMRTDFLFCTHDARFKLPEAAFGFVAAWGGSQLCSRHMSFRRAQEFLLLAQTLDGREAEAASLVTRSLENSDALDHHVGATLARLRTISPNAFAQTKRSLAARWDAGIAHGLAVEDDCEIAAMRSRDFVSGLAAAEGHKAFDFVGAEIVDKASR